MKENLLNKIEIITAWNKQIFPYKTFIYKKIKMMLIMNKISLL